MNSWSIFSVMLVAILTLVVAAPPKAIDLEYEYIVVGSGAGGGPLACRLAMAGHKTLLIEAGDDQVSGASNPEHVFLLTRCRTVTSTSQSLPIKDSSLKTLSFDGTSLSITTRINNVLSVTRSTVTRSLPTLTMSAQIHPQERSLLVSCILVQVLSAAVCHITRLFGSCKNSQTSSCGCCYC